MYKNTQAFTLIEILIVIVIILVITGLIFPVLSKIREKSNQAVCMSNMGQMFKCLVQYTIENDGYLPLEDNSGTSDSGTPCSGEAWLNHVQK